MLHFNPVVVTFTDGKFTIMKLLPNNILIYFYSIMIFESEPHSRVKTMDTALEWSGKTIFLKLRSTTIREFLKTQPEYQEQFEKTAKLATYVTTVTPSRKNKLQPGDQNADENKQICCVLVIVAMDKRYKSQSCDVHMLQFKYHGNHCGPGYTDGRYTFGYSKGDVRPIDKLDQVCSDHDVANNKPGWKFYDDWKFAKEAWNTGWKGKLAAPFVFFQPWKYTYGKQVDVHPKSPTNKTQHALMGNLSKEGKKRRNKKKAQKKKQKRQQQRQNPPKKQLPKKSNKQDTTCIDGKFVKRR